MAIRGVELSRGGESTWYDIELTPLVGGDGTLLATAVSFTDTTQLRRLNDSVEATRERLETAYEELQSTAEELETTNEELQSTNEELETTNEELQSTNEELETMNEELQSTNEELETINDELRQRTDELNASNAVFESVLSGLATAVLVVDDELRVRAWNGEATELWGLREDEVQGAYLPGLDIGLPVAEVARLVTGAIDSGAEAESELEAMNRRGRSFHCRIRVVPLAPPCAWRGAIVQAEEVTAA
jgi:two-component system CheB/CheR fusion protein